MKKCRWYSDLDRSGLKIEQPKGTVDNKPMLNVLKILGIMVLLPALLIAGYITYLWASYIDETIVVGTAYGFTIGQKKGEAIEEFSELSIHYPALHVYVSYSQKAGDYFSIPATRDSFERLQTHNKWTLLLKGKGEYFDSIQLTFHDDSLSEIHRHRKNFELP